MATESEVMSPCRYHVACVYLSVVWSTIISIQDCLFCQQQFPDMFVLSTMISRYDCVVNHAFNA